MPFLKEFQKIEREINKLENGDMYLFFHSGRELLKNDQMSLYSCFYPRKKKKNETVDYKHEQSK